MTPTPPNRLHPEELAVWQGFLTTHAQIVRRLDALLTASHDMPLAHFDVLVQLAMAGGRLRMTELADALLVSRSGATRIVAALVDLDLLCRERDPQDARGTVACLTPLGRATLSHAADQHIANVRRLFLSAVPAEDRTTLTRIWDDVQAAIADEPRTPVRRRPNGRGASSRLRGLR